MARTIEEIYNEMITEKETMSTLSSLTPDPDTYSTLLSAVTSGSKVAIWRLILFIQAVAIWVHEKLYDEHKAEIEAAIQAAVPGTLRWYREQAFIFQYGDNLTWDAESNKYVYDPIDESAQIVAFSSAQESAGQVRIKVAKDDGSGFPAKLASAEETAFTEYMQLIRFAGTNLAVITKDPDLLKVAFDIYYDPLVLAADGEDLDNAGSYPVEDAIHEYIANLRFDGFLVLNELIDAVQAVDGVANPVLTTAEAKYGALSYSAITVKYQADAGHMKIDPAFPLSGQLTYKPK